MRINDRLLLFYLVSSAAVAIAIALTVTSIATPHWLTSVSYPEDEDGNPVRITYGLHQKCSSVTGQCVRFPDQECAHGDRQFCTSWRTASFMMWMSLVLLGPVVVSYVTLIFSTRQKRETGWKLIGLLLICTVVVQVVAMASVVYMLGHDDNLRDRSWQLGPSWAAATLSWIVVFATFVATVVVGVKTVPEYSAIPLYMAELGRRPQSSRRSSVSSNWLM
ncbi:hypothetical protein BZA70DRAFT_12141 [Myxozyma melibiosi]|uniref:Uncharacterized protein n=1 Tax=Myxozyma melibiosi TaxID=54550 RepID=A0ABR1FC13_9ASCO